jgi:hypothetical protein
MPPINLPDSILDAPLFGTEPKEPETLTPEQEQRRALGDSAYEAIQNNIKTMNEAGVPAPTILSYLDDVGVTVGQQKDSNKYEAVSLRSLGSSALGGGTRGLMSLGAIPTIVVDTYWHMMKRAGEDLAGGRPADIYTAFDDFDPTLTKLQQSGVDHIVDAVDHNTPEGEVSRFANRASEKTFEYVVPGAAMVAGFTTQGAKLLASNPEGAGMIQRMMIEMAKNPAKAQAYEAGLGTAAAIAGEAAVTNVAGTDPELRANSEWIRLGAEVTTLATSIIGQRFAARITDFAKSKLLFGEKHMKDAAEFQVGKWLNEIMEADPNIADNIAKVRELEQMGVLGDVINLGDNVGAGSTFLTPDVLQNPQIQAAMDAIVATGDTTATRFARTLEAATKRVEDFADGLKPIIQASDPKNMQPTLQRYITRELDAIDRRTEAAIRKAVDEAAALRPNRSSREIGESAYVQINALEEEAIKKVDDLYNQLDNSLDYPIKQIRQSLIQAGMSPRVLAENKKRVAQGLEPIMGLKGNTSSNKFMEGILETGALNFLEEGTDRVPMIVIREWRQEINNQMRAAVRAQDWDSVTRLTTLRNGVDKQFDVMRRNAHGKARVVFKEANEMWEEVRNRFDRSHAQVMSQQFILGRNNLHPSDFSRHWIIPNKSKGAVKAAEDYRFAFGDSEESKVFIEESVRWELSQMKTKEGALDMPLIQRWLSDREQSLRAHGVWNKFDDVGKASMAATEAQATGIIDKNRFLTQQFEKLVGLSGAKNVDRYIGELVRAGRLGELRAQVAATGNEGLLRVFKQKAMNTILSESESVTVDSVGQIARNPSLLHISLEKHSDDIIRALGKDHYNDLRTISEVYKLNFGKVQTFGSRATDLAKVPVVNQQQLGRAMSKIRASLQGFVSPEYTAVQLGNQALDLLNSKVASQVLEEAMFNWKYAETLAGIAKTKAGQHALRLFATPPAAAVGLSHLQEDDARTEL